MAIENERYHVASRELAMPCTACNVHLLGKLLLSWGHACISIVSLFRVLKYVGSKAIYIYIYIYFGTHLGPSSASFGALLGPSWAPRGFWGAGPGPLGREV